MFAHHPCRGHGLLHELSGRRRSRHRRELEEPVAQDDGHGDVDHELAGKRGACSLEEGRQRGGRQGQHDALGARDRVQVLDALGDGAGHRGPDSAGGRVGP